MPNKITNFENYRKRDDYDAYDPDERYDTGNMYEDMHDYDGRDYDDQDYADDEAGRLPIGLKRGVLSEDGIWNLLEDVCELNERLKTK